MGTFAPVDPRQEAIDCLRSDGPLSDPRYLTPNKAAEAEKRLKERCRKCWALRKHFPAWLEWWIAKWSGEGKSKDWAA
jgi:hypothetical protein